MSLRKLQQSAVLWPLLLMASVALGQGPGVIRSEPIFVEAPFAECHASTLLEVPTDEGQVLLAAWFGGTEEGHSDVGIWLSRRSPAGQWSPPVEIATGRGSASSREQGGASSAAASKGRLPTWNPVLFRSLFDPEAPIMLFFKVGPNPREWWGEWIESTDAGVTWSAARRLPKGILGPIKNKPIEIALTTQPTAVRETGLGESAGRGVILSGSSTEHDGWRVHFERSEDGGETWSRIGPIASGTEFPQPIGAIQPTLLRHADGRIQALSRSQQAVVVESWSHDLGKTWSPLTGTSLPNPNAGIDGVTLSDGRQLLVYNHKVRDRGRWQGSRSRLNVALSEDGVIWQAAVELENQPGEYSYPAVIQSVDGTVHISYTWRRKRIQHVEIDPAALVPLPLSDGKWPERGAR